MTKRIILAGVLGGIAMFIWSFIGHDLLSLGEAGIREIPNEATFLDAVKNNLSDDGLYMFPGLGLGPDATRQQKSEAMKQVVEKTASGPSGMIMYHPTREFVFGKLLATEFATELLESFLVVFLLAQTSIGSFGGRLGFVLVAGILAAVATNVSYWNWYGFPGVYVSAYMLIQIVGFICVGIIAGLVFGKSKAT
jgi:hypothetical protein